ncbi:MAG: nuclear transport factor 2 family protein [Bacteroidota bacterium]
MFVLAHGCSDDTSHVVPEVQAALDAFHTADTSMHAQGVIDLLWPEYTMFADGARVGYEDVVDGSKAFMGSLTFFQTTWSDIQIIPLAPDLAISSFVFRDSILKQDGTLLQSKGPNSFVWQKRAGEWRVLYGDADHYPIDQ